MPPGNGGSDVAGTSEIGGDLRAKRSGSGVLRRAVAPGITSAPDPVRLYPYPEDLTIPTKGLFTRPERGNRVPDGRPEQPREAREGASSGYAWSG